MAVVVKIPTLMRVNVDGAASVEATGVTVGEIFSDLITRFPGLESNLIDDDGNLHKFVNVYRDDDDIRYLDGLATPVSEGAVISILPAVAGG